MTNSSTFHNRRLVSYFLAAFAFVCLAVPARSLSPNKTISQYMSDRWGQDQGFPGGLVYAIAQTPDGYLWIGTERGLVRFDGFSFRLVQAQGAREWPIGPVLGLTVDRAGSLWVQTRGAKFFRYRAGTFEDVVPKLGLAENNITAMCVGSEGNILFAGLVNGLLEEKDGQFIELTARDPLPRLIISIAQTSDGAVWLGTREQGLFYVQGKKTSQITGLPDRKINALLPLSDHDLLVGTDSGIWHWNGKEFSRKEMFRSFSHTQVLAMSRDRDSNVWAATSSGLFRISPAGEIEGERTENGTQAKATAVFEDREGNLWAGGDGELRRLRDSVFTTYSFAIGKSSENGPIYVDSQGRVWFAPSAGGLYWFKNGAPVPVNEADLGTDVVYSISGGGDSVWAGRKKGGLTQLRFHGQSLTSKTYSVKQGLPQNSIYVVHQCRDGTIWAGSVSGGVSRFRDNHFTNYTTANGLLSNSISSISESADGTVWVGTANGLNAFANGEWRSYTTRDGLPPGNVNSIFEDSTGAVWVGTANGIGFVRSGKAQTALSVWGLMNDSILGIREDRTGALWVAAQNRVLRFDRDQMLRGSIEVEDVREFGPADGLVGTQGVRRSETVVSDSLGRIWFSRDRGLCFVDPRPINESSAPAKVFVDELSADGRPIFSAGGDGAQRNLQKAIRVPSPHQRITFSFTGLSLSVPDRIRFRYRLDNFDPAWSEPTQAREAVYTNLDPGSYRFRVIASNSEGIWNSAESALTVQVAPVFWRTWWFRLGAALLVGLLILAFVRLRMLSLAHQMNVRFEERLAERTRISQDLHDTLLQGILSASMQLHLADEHLPAESRAKPIVGRVLELMACVVQEGRNALQGLRPSKRSDSMDLEKAFSQIRDEFPIEGQAFRVIVEGSPRPLRPLIGDEVYLIGREALSNAFRHSHASAVEVELEFSENHLRVLVRDDGTGITPEVLQEGKQGHWGLSGMKGRAEKIGARLRLLSHREAGTEIELLVPARTAFQSASLAGSSKAFLAGIRR